MSLGQLFELSSAEFSFWVDFAARRGFPVDRLEAATAISGAAVARTWGSKVRPEDLIPKFGHRRGASGAQLLAFLKRVKGAKVERRNKKGGPSHGKQ